MRWIRVRIFSLGKTTMFFSRALLKGNFFFPFCSWLSVTPMMAILLLRNILGSL